MTAKFLMLLSLAAGTAALTGCASEFATDPTKPRPTRAVESPVEQGSGLGEVITGNTDTIPLVKITDSGKKNEPPQVYTIIDGVRDLNAEPATTRPRVEPATLPAPTQIDPVFGRNH